MIDASISSEKYAIKKCHLIKSNPSAIRVIVPKEWDSEYVNIMLWESDISSFSLEDGTYHFNVKNCGEIMLKKVSKDSRRHYVYIPKMYDSCEILIVPA